MKILYVALKYDYGYRDRGYSFEHYNFYDTLVNMGHEVIYFDFMSLFQDKGKWAMNRRLEEVARSEQPDLMFTVLFGEQLDRQVVRRIGAKGYATTVNWFCDDNWRFGDFTRFWAPCFDFSVTTSRDALSFYKNIGYDRVIKSQWGVNHYLYRKLDLPLKYDITFVGQAYGIRKKVVDYLRDQGFQVECWGSGWKNGRLGQQEMIEVFNQSRINLNLSTTSAQPTWPRDKLKAMLSRTASRLLTQLPRGEIVKEKVRALLLGPRPRNSESDPLTDLSPITADSAQIKGRDFEVPGCGGLLVGSELPELHEYFSPGREVVSAASAGQLARMCRQLLDDETGRQGIARAGYARALSCHTYEHRFNEIFKAIQSWQ